MTRRSISNRLPNCNATITAASGGHADNYATGSMQIVQLERHHRSNKNLQHFLWITAALLVVGQFRMTGMEMIKWR
jgi:hypothetical protein